MNDLLYILKEADTTFEESGLMAWELKEEIKRLEGFIKLGKKFEKLVKEDKIICPSCGKEFEEKYMDGFECIGCAELRQEYLS